MKAHTRSAGKSAVANAAYRSGSSIVAKVAYRSGDKVYGNREDKTHDYTNKPGVLHTEIIAPEHTGDTLRDREKLWNYVEDREKRKDALLAKEVVLTLPRNLTHEQHREVVNRWVGDCLTSRDLIADVAYHRTDAADGKGNPHAHIMFTARPVEADGETLGKKQTGYGKLDNGLQGLDSKLTLHQFRQTYEDHLNAVSWEDNQTVKFDLHRDKDKPLIRPLSWQAYFAEKNGQKSWEGRRNFREKLFHQGDKEIRRHVNSFKQIGGGSHHHAYFVESVRHDMGETWYDFAYGSEEAERIIDSDEKGFHR